MKRLVITGRVQYKKSRNYELLDDPREIETLEIEEEIFPMGHLSPAIIEHDYIRFSESPLPEPLQTIQEINDFLWFAREHESSTIFPREMDAPKVFFAGLRELNTSLEVNIRKRRLKLLEQDIPLSDSLLSLSTTLHVNPRWEFDSLYTQYHPEIDELPKRVRFEPDPRLPALMDELYVLYQKYAKDHFDARSLVPKLEAGVLFLPDMDVGKLARTEAKDVAEAVTKLHAMADKILDNSPEHTEKSVILSLLDDGLSKEDKERHYERIRNRINKIRGTKINKTWQQSKACS